MEYFYYGDKGVFDTAPILYYLPDYQDQIYTVQRPAAEAFHFEKLMFHVVWIKYFLFPFRDLCFQVID